MEGLEQDRKFLQALCNFTGLTPSALARGAGLASTTILRSYNGSATTRLSQPTLDKLQARFPDFPQWLPGHVADRQLSFRQRLAERDPDLVDIAQIDLQFGLGGTYLEGPVEECRRSFSRSWLNLFTRAAPEHLFWAVGDGDSMRPTINSGDVILIDRSQINPLMGDGIWAIAYGEGGMVKRLRPLPDGTIEVHSDNDRVRPFTAADGELHVIGRVIARIERL